VPLPSAERELQLCVRAVRLPRGVFGGGGDRAGLPSARDGERR
jgi:hypothetical protein